MGRSGRRGRDSPRRACGCPAGLPTLPHTHCRAPLAAFMPLATALRCPGQPRGQPLSLLPPAGPVKQHIELNWQGRLGGSGSSPARPAAVGPGKLPSAASTGCCVRRAEGWSSRGAAAAGAVRCRADRYVWCRRSWQPPQLVAAVGSTPSSSFSVGKYRPQPPAACPRMPAMIAGVVSAAARHRGGFRHSRCGLSCVGCNPHRLGAPLKGSRQLNVARWSALQPVHSRASAAGHASQPANQPACSPTASCGAGAPRVSAPAACCGKVTVCCVLGAVLSRRDNALPCCSTVQATPFEHCASTSCSRPTHCGGSTACHVSTTQPQCCTAECQPGRPSFAALMCAAAACSRLAAVLGR